MSGLAQVGGQELNPDSAEFMVRRLRIFQTEAGNATVGSGDWHGDGDGDDAGSEIYLLPLYDKGIYAEGLLFNLDWPCGGVPVAAEIMSGRARVGGQESYRGHLGWNPQSELDYTGITGTMAKSSVCEGALVKTIPPHQDGQQQQSRGCMRGTRYQQQPP